MKLPTLGILALLTLTFQTGHAASIPAITEQPRPFGYVLGDTLTQRVLLQSAAGAEFIPAALPPVERAGLWFARRSVRIERGDKARRWLVLEYQLINAPQTLMTVNLPPVSLKPQTGTTELAVPDWPVSIAPLTPRAAFAKGGLQDLRPDHAAPGLPTHTLRRQMEVSLGAFLVIATIWVGWWVFRQVSAAANQPFARALREIRRSDADSSAPWLALHRAFDRTAGRSLQLGNLTTLFQCAPHFAAERTAIERFYDESSRRFFGVEPSRPAAGANSVYLRSLCATLRKIEKRNER